MTAWRTVGFVLGTTSITSVSSVPSHLAGSAKCRPCVTDLDHLDARFLVGPHLGKFETWSSSLDGLGDRLFRTAPFDLIGLNCWSAHKERSDLGEQFACHLTISVCGQVLFCFPGTDADNLIASL